jgi:hypothetical protein
MSKPRIIVYNPCNEKTRYFRNYNFFWDSFTHYLKQYFEVEENRYFEGADRERWQVQLKNSISNNFLLLECEYVVENADTGEFHVMSVSDDFSHASLNEKSNPFCKSVLLSQFNPSKVKSHTGEYYFKYKPWIYFQSLFDNLDMFYHKRQHIKEKSNTLFFKGTSIQDRSFLSHLDKNYVSDFSPTNPNDYFNQLIAHKLAISIDGRGEFCYRDVECFGCGVPIIRYEYESILNEPLIPNYHYISIPRPQDMTLYRTGTKEHADKFMEKYFEVINNDRLLAFISKNAREYYEKNLSLKPSLDKTFEILKLKEWL